MSANTGLIIAAVVAIVTGLLACAAVVTALPVQPLMIAMGPFCLVWGIAMLCFALVTRRYFR